MGNLFLFDEVRWVRHPVLGLLSSEQNLFNL